MVGCVLALGAAASGQEQEAGDDRLARQVEAFAAAYQQGDYDAAVDIGGVALAMSQRAFGDDPLRTGFLMLNLARAHLRRGGLQEAEPLFRQARTLFAEAFGDSNPAVIDADLGLATIADHENPEQATALYAAIIERMRVIDGYDPVVLANAEVGLARSLRRNGDDGAARDIYRAAIADLERELGLHHPAVAQARAEAAILQGSRWIAAEHLSDGWRILRTVLGDRHPDVVQIGLAAAQSKLDLGLAFDALEIGLPVAAASESDSLAQDAAMVVRSAWLALDDPAGMVRTVRAATPEESAPTAAKALAAAHLAITLIRLNRSVDSVLAIDRGRGFVDSSGNDEPNLAVALALIGDPAQSVDATVHASDLLAEATDIAARLDPTHPRRAEILALVGLATARAALLDGRAGEARDLARDTIDQVTDGVDPRGILRLRLRATLAAALVGDGGWRKAAVACNGLERDVAAARRWFPGSIQSGGRPLITPTEAIRVLEFCAGLWRESGAHDRAGVITAAIETWRMAAATWPARGLESPDPGD